MGHRAVLYSVTVHERYKKPLLEFGQLDHSGAYLGDFLKSLFGTKFGAKSEDGLADVTCSNVKLVEPDLQVILNPGKSGTRADIADANGQTQFEQQAEHTHILKSASLFRLPRGEKNGWWALHVNDNRGLKSLVVAAMQKAFKKQFPDLVLTIDPAISSAAYLAALEEGDLLSAKLYKHMKPSDISQGDKWAKTDTGFKTTLSIAPDPGGRLKTALVKKAVKGDSQAKNSVVSFGGLTFDKATVEVELANGSTRTFNVEQPESGHAFSEDIQPSPDRDGHPSDESLFKELSRVLADFE